jgi:hypothetical protein
MRSLDLVLVALLAASWAVAGWRANQLSYVSSPRGLRRSAAVVMAVVAVGLVLSLARVVVVAAIGQWSLVQPAVVLALPLLLVPAGATVAFAVPRLLHVRRAARTFPHVLPPSLRQEAAHPLLAWPVQLTALGAGAGVFVAVVMSYPATAGLSFAVSAAVGLGGLAAWQRLRSRHVRIGGTVVFPSPWARAARSAAVVVTVAIAAVLGPLAALAVAAPA